MELLKKTPKVVFLSGFVHNPVESFWFFFFANLENVARLSIKCLKSADKRKTKKEKPHTHTDTKTTNQTKQQQQRNLHIYVL